MNEKEIKELKDAVYNLQHWNQSTENFEQIGNLQEVLRELGYDYIRHMKREHSYMIPLKIEDVLKKLDMNAKGTEVDKTENKEVHDRLERFKLGMTEKEYEKYKKGRKDSGGEKVDEEGFVLDNIRPWEKRNYLISEFGKRLKDLEHWSIEGLEIIPRSLVLKLIKEYEGKLE